MIDVNVGDAVVRNLAGILMPMRVTAVTDQLIICGGDEKEHVGWWFDKATGAEIDEDLSWGPPPLSTGSFLMRNQERGFTVPHEIAKKIAEAEDVKERFLAQE